MKNYRWVSLKKILKKSSCFVIISFNSLFGLVQYEYKRFDIHITDSIWHDIGYSMHMLKQESISVLRSIFALLRLHGSAILFSYIVLLHTMFIICKSLFDFILIVLFFWLLEIKKYWDFLSIKGQRYKSHRFVWSKVTGVWSSEIFTSGIVLLNILYTK